MSPELRKREIAYKLRIGDILRGKPILETIDESSRFNFLELEDRKIKRVNVVSNIIEKFVSEGEKKFGSLTLDDASGQIRAKMFGDDVKKVLEMNQGDTILIIGLLRVYNEELYVLPEIIQKIDPRYLLVRKLELEKTQTPKPTNESSSKTKEVKEQIIEMIKKAENDGGIDTEKLIMEIKNTPETINKELQRLLEEGIVYEPRPGIVRYLG